MIVATYVPRHMLRGLMLAGVSALASPAMAQAPVGATPAQPTADRPAGSAIPDRGVPIRLAPMNLERALDAIASRQGVTIIYDPATVRTRTSSPVDAANAPQAIQQAIAGTGLSMITGERGYRVGEEEVQSGEVIVRAARNEAETGYAVQAVSSATRDGKSLREQPQSTTVVTAKAIADQQTQTVTDTLRNVSGATVSFNPQGAAVLTVRGNTATPTSGGINTPTAGSEPVANIERVEVLKGPAALLAGAGNLGGIVNIVSKRPIAKPLLDVSAEYASWNEKKLTIDGSTPLDPDRRFSARLVLQADDASDSPGDYDGKHEYLIAPSIRYKTENSDFTLGAQGSDVRLPAPQFGFFAAGVLTPFNRRLGPENSGIRTQERRFWFDFSQKVTDWLTLSSRGLRSDQEALLQIAAPLTTPTATSNAIFVLRTDSEQRNRTDGIDSYARINFGRGKVENTLVLGYNYGRYRLRGYGLPNTVSSFFPIANYLTSDLSLGGTFPNPGTPGLRQVQEQNGFYAQDTLKVGPLHVVGSVRRTEYTQQQDVPNVTPSPAFPARKSYRSTTPSIGAVLDLSRNISLYANYLEGFVPNFTVQTTPPYDLLPPITSNNIEGGVKIDLFGSRLAFVGSAYRLRQYNLASYDFTTNQQLSIDGLETRGIDLDLRGQITRGWNVLASASFNDFKYLSVQQAANVVLAQPKRRYSVFTSYEVPDGALKGLGAGVGVFHFSKTDTAFTAIAANRRILPGQTEVNANLYYTIGKVRLNLGVTNVFDKELYNVSVNQSYISRRAPRAVRGTVTYSFF